MEWMLKLADDILTAWKVKDEEQLDQLLKKVPYGWVACIVNPDAVNPVIVLTNKMDIKSMKNGYRVLPPRKDEKVTVAHEDEDKPIIRRKEL